MRVIESRRRIDAPPELVWELLVDFEAYPEWNPFITSIEGVPLPDQRLRVRIEPPGSRSATFRPRVTISEKNRRLEWKGSLFVPGLFDGRHEFRIEREGRRKDGRKDGREDGRKDGRKDGREDGRKDGREDAGDRVRFVQRETFSGLLVSTLLKESSIRRGFDAMNNALAERAEARVAADAR